MQSSEQLNGILHENFYMLLFWMTMQPGFEQQYCDIKGLFTSWL